MTPPRPRLLTVDRVADAVERRDLEVLVEVASAHRDVGQELRRRAAMRRYFDLLRNDGVTTPTRRGAARIAAREFELSERSIREWERCGWYSPGSLGPRPSRG